MSEPEDVLADSLETLYDHAPIAQGSAGSLYTYQSQNGGHTIALTTPDTQAANWALHATSIWSASIYVADHFLDLQISRRAKQAAEEGRSLKVLELGAGAGLPSILVAKSYQDVLVTCSDYPDDALIRTLQENVKRNDASSSCRVVPYAWGSDPSVLLPPGTTTDEAPAFDIVLAADTLWNSDTHHLFLDTLRRTLRRSPNARIYLIAGLHTGRYVLQSFLRLMHDSGFVTEELTERRIGATEERPWSVDRAEGEDERERRRWIVWMVFKWRDC
ncbi:uncharacterized protein TRAVEDRAFT_47692 [Trametes versicolor FP-101664 SS1]|uniref:uncharacterized protein n=1 Tax=Trametes versicolor (strain FP-101664) TaxID=717944 RepID=UPI00046236BF|nr:uncharacterized protein TRAVEDRAFT_47692 [Trametes versicolor FP-101664 SS1]EIW58548.1 hypothetical protein TRAVEDRAFT_47692 [Trametes versicolor FP-101664 SS1]